jgi:hypothetical protein
MDFRCQMWNGREHRVPTLEIQLSSSSRPCSRRQLFRAHAPVMRQLIMKDYSCRRDGSNSVASAFTDVSFLQFAGNKKQRGLHPSKGLYASHSALWSFTPECNSGSRSEIIAEQTS